jgi:hypothetical protein
MAQHHTGYQNEINRIRSYGTNDPNNPLPLPKICFMVLALKLEKMAMIMNTCEDCFWKNNQIIPNIMNKHGLNQLMFGFSADKCEFCSYQFERYIDPISKQKVEKGIEEFKKNGGKPIPKLQ